MHDHAGGVHHAVQQRRPQRARPARCASATTSSALDGPAVGRPRARGVDGRPGTVDEQRLRQAVERADHPIDAGQRPPRVASHARLHGVRSVRPQRRSRPPRPIRCRSYNGGVKASKAAVREAATVMLVRDAPELQVFMLRRNPESVFVGRRVRVPGWGRRRRRTDARRRPRTAGCWVRRRFGSRRSSRSRKPACCSPAPRPTTPARRRRAGAMARARRRPASRCSPARATFADVLDAHDAVARPRRARPRSATGSRPSPSPRRFDTWFFVAAAPEGHVYEHDDDETRRVGVDPPGRRARPRPAPARSSSSTRRPHAAGDGRATRRAADFLAAVDARWRTPRPAAGR